MTTITHIGCPACGTPMVMRHLQTDDGKPFVAHQCPNCGRTASRRDGPGAGMPSLGVSSLELPGASANRLAFSGAAPGDAGRPATGSDGMTIWRVGMKAGCVDDAWRVGAGLENEQHPVKGQVLTVNHIERHRGLIGLGFEEMPSVACYCASYFRPAVDRPTSIAVFTEILDRETRRQALPASVE